MSTEIYIKHIMNFKDEYKGIIPSRENARLVPSFGKGEKYLKYEDSEFVRRK